jgi:cytochrome d ubiquinol oxidase subunit II
MLLGWGLGHREYLIYPDVRMLEARGSVATIRFLLLSLPVGLGMLVPSLVLLFRVFKGVPERGMVGGAHPTGPTRAGN